jgi:hypothetical protein|tara:strand:- start:1203 stop:1730 length:528 start_codon:yes stop_codon:yes gene_type:complete
MIMGLDVSTSMTGVAFVDDDGELIYNEVWDLRKYKNFFTKANIIKEKIENLPYKPQKVFIEQSLQSFRSGFSSAATLSTLSRFNGVVSWICFSHLSMEPDYLAATSARKMCGIKVPRGTKAKEVVLKYILTSESSFDIVYTKHGNPKPGTYDKADAIVIARAGYNLCQKQKKEES